MTILLLIQRHYGLQVKKILPISLKYIHNFQSLCQAESMNWRRRLRQTMIIVMINHVRSRNMSDGLDGSSRYVMYPYQRKNRIMLINFYSIPKQAIVIIIPHPWLLCFEHWISLQDGQKDLRAGKR